VSLIVVLDEKLLDVDFEDVKTVMSESGLGVMGTAVAGGPDRATQAADSAVACPPLEGIDLSGARGVLVLIAASKATRGSQYAAKDFRDALPEYGITASMSRRGNCWDNACSETLFGSLKVERLHGQRFRTRRQAKDEVIAWVL
jgi:transposase InsO family protein